MSLPGPLGGLRVVEIGDESVEYCGLLLAGLGAEVVKVEPPGGSPTRRIGPFYEDDEGPERSLFFWQYNRAKRSVALDAGSDGGRAWLDDRLAGADVLLTVGEPTPGLQARHPHLVVARITPFGDEGPWAGYKGSDLVHLALGGVMMNCGYDPEPDGFYDLPPIAPQMWHAYHIAGEHLAVGIAAALLYRHRTGRGQDVSCAVHQAVATNTELDTMTWTMLRTPVLRRTCRHATAEMDVVPMIGSTKDVRWILPFVFQRGRRSNDQTVEFLARYGLAPDEVVEAQQAGAAVPGSSAMSEQTARIAQLAHRFFAKYTYERLPWREAQEAGLLWSPLRRPHENLDDEHWQARSTFAEVEHPAVGRSLPYPVRKWISTTTAWQAGPAAPSVGEHDDAYPAGSWAPRIDDVRERAEEPLSRRGTPFALADVRILDFTWFLASSGATRFLAALGAECLKVEWKGNPDTRIGAMAPVGGREARRSATGPLKGVTDTDMGGQFNNKNAGKRGISLNVRDPRGLDIAKRLVELSDIVAEGFSPGVMDRWGLGYDALRAIRPDVIYAQQSGFGSAGTHGRYRAVGPIAAAMSGLSEMSGLPEPAMPAGWGYSYLDWIGAYSFAFAMLTALYHREATGEGQWIDASQCEAGLFLGGTAYLDWAANGREWGRTGNRSIYKPAAPHGAYRTEGDDRWIAIACFDEDEWRGLVDTLANPAWAGGPRFATLPDRVAHQDELDRLVEAETRSRDGYELMERLQAAGVPAGVCQNAEDKCDRDPQLAKLDWLTELTGTKIGEWPVVEVPLHFSETPPFVGGRIDRAAPTYGEDNELILGDLLGISTKEIRQLAEDGVI
jgi:crotonobetainyl-CoA:carnitine CoA-transferase CaiB-like acyl-CoA transferase